MSIESQDAGVAHRLRSGGTLAGGILACCILVPACCERGLQVPVVSQEQVDHGPALTADQVKARIQDLPGWPESWHDLPLTSDQWLQTCQLASQLQETDTEVVRRALQAFVSEYGGGKYAGPLSPPQEWTKALLLLRVMFDLPDEPYDAKKREHRRIKFGGFIPAYHGVSDEEINRREDSLSWPIHWTATGPELPCYLAAYSGPNYDVDGEFTLLLRHYRFRNLRPTIQLLKRRLVTGSRPENP
jgi:hypothetical protein